MDATSDITTDEPTLSRRRMMQATGAAVATVGIGASASPAAAETTLNYDSGLAPNPTILDTVTFGVHDRDHMAAVTEYVPDSSDSAEDGTEDLADDGAVVAPRPTYDPDAYDDTQDPHNPVSLSAAAIEASEFWSFPRDEMFDDDGDGEKNTELSALDQQHWTENTADISVTAADGPGKHALNVASSGVAAGASTSATFTDVLIDDGIDRRHVQLVVDINQLDTDASMEFRMDDGAGTYKTVKIDDAGDAANDDVIASTTGTSLAFQTELGQLATDISKIEQLDITILDGDVDVTFYAMNVERSSQWEFGTEEYYDSADDEVKTQTVYEPSGSYSITGVDTLGTVFDTARLHDLSADLWVRAANVASSQIDFEFSDAENYPSFERRFEGVVNLELKTAYDLTHNVTGLKDEVMLPSNRYLNVDYTASADGQEGDYVTLDDYEDIDWTDTASTYDGGSEGDRVDITSLVSEGNVVAMFFDTKHTEAEESDMTASAAVGPTGKEGGSFIDRILTIPGMVGSVLAGWGVMKIFGGIRG